MTAADSYAARVDAVLEQRTRLRGSQPQGDFFGDLPDDHVLMRVSPHAPLSETLAVIAEFVGGDDSLLDVGGGAGRYSLPLALRCRDVLNVEGSSAMAAAFERNAGDADITNAEAIVDEWPTVETRTADVVLVNHVAYLTRDIGGFVAGLQAAAQKRVVMTVWNPPPPARNAAIYELVYGEAEVIVPGASELLTVLWEMDIRPEIQLLPTGYLPPESPNREAAIRWALSVVLSEQWAFWPPGDALQSRVQAVFETRFDELFEETAGGFTPRWQQQGAEMLITWTTND